MLQRLTRHFEHWLFDLPEAVGGRPLAWLAAPLRYVYALLRDLARGDLGLRAMSLVYSSLFAIVPVVAVAFAMLKLLGYDRELEPVLFEFLRPLGEQGYVLTAQIMAFVENLRGTLLGTVGVAILIYTVLTMILKVEEALNFVWRVDRPRSLARRLTEYLVVALVGPLVAIMAMVMLARFEASVVLDRLSGAVGTPSFHLAPYVLMVGLFYFVYVYMPNTRVRWGAAAVGALAAGVLWAMVGAAFARVVVYSATTMAVYASFAVVLLFLVWLHLSWLILLLGSQLAYYVQHPEQLRAGRVDLVLPGALRERIALSLMSLLGQRFVSGGPRWRVDDLAERLDVPGTSLDRVIDSLEARGLVLTADDDTIAPARDLASIPLTDVLDAVRMGVADRRLPRPRAVPEADRHAAAADAGLHAGVAARTVRDLVA